MSTRRAIVEEDAKTVAGVIETLPLTRLCSLIIAAASLGYLFDAFDTYIVSFAMPSIAAEWRLTPVFNGMLSSAGMWGMFVGAMAWGPIVDRSGRKSGFVATVLGFSIVSGFTAAATGTTQFLVLRFISGLFLGGMLPVVSALVAEYVSARHRGRAVAVPPIFWPVGLFAAAVAAKLLVPHFGWRSLFVVGVLPAFLAWFLVRRLPESPRWLVTKGRNKEAASVLRALGATENQVRDLAPEPIVADVPVRLLLRPPYLRRFVLTTSVLFFGFFGYYGFVLWLPSILVIHFKMSLATTFTYTVFVGVFAILGKIAAFLTVDRFGRRQLFYVGYGLAGVASLVFGLLHNPTHLLIGACVLSFLLEEAAAGCVVLPTELFPSHVRGTANSWTSAAGKLGSACSPLLFGLLMAKDMYYGIFITMAAFFWIACLMVLTFGIETRNKTLQDVGAA
jgi:putative MFS transporter